MHSQALAQIAALRQAYEADTLQVVPRDAEEQATQECQLLLARYYEAADKVAQKQRREPDSDGWVTVGYRKGAAAAATATAAAATDDAANGADEAAGSATKKATRAKAQARRAKAQAAEAPADESMAAAKALVFGRGQSRARRQLERQRRREKAATELRRAAMDAGSRSAQLEAKQDRVGALRRSFADKLKSLADLRRFRPDA